MKNLSPETRSNIKMALIGLMVLVLIIAAAFLFDCWENGGTVFDQPVNLATLSDDNPVRRKNGVEQGTSAIVIVKDLSHYKTGVMAVMAENKNINVRIWMSEKDIAKLDVGDVIKVRGQVSYHESYHYKSIVIGHRSNIFPLSHNAKLVSIDKKSDQTNEVN